MVTKIQHIYGVSLLLGIAACGPGLADVARQRGAADLDCSPEFVDAYRARGGVYVARGCERWVQYTCVPSAAGPVCIAESKAEAKPMPGS
jgi:hypothetical protein